MNVHEPTQPKEKVHAINSVQLRPTFDHRLWFSGRHSCRHSLATALSLASASALTYHSIHPLIPLGAPNRMVFMIILGAGSPDQMLRFRSAARLRGHFSNSIEARHRRQIRWALGTIFKWSFPLKPVVGGFTVDRAGLLRVYHDLVAGASHTAINYLACVLSSAKAYLVGKISGKFHQRGSNWRTLVSSLLDIYSSYRLVNILLH